ncbi:MAG: ferrous iron transport protein A [Candidatus Accumulibacter sp.]|jgi:ferrous iron transport protein A|nr:ferrous iron transport protein A [Accumulibacter sp.]
MVPLTTMSVGEQAAVKRVNGKPEVRQFLENLGFVPGSLVCLIAKNGGNIIVNVKDSRVAISSGMANKIFV